MIKVTDKTQEPKTTRVRDVKLGQLFVVNSNPGYVWMRTTDPSGTGLDFWAVDMTGLDFWAVDMRGALAHWTGLDRPCTLLDGELIVTRADQS